MTRSILSLSLLLIQLYSFCQHPLADYVTEIKKQNDVVTVAHRGGAYADFPENSIEITDFLLSQNPGRPIIIEIDIRKSADGILYLMHDTSLKRTTDVDRLIADCHSDELSSLYLKAPSGKTSASKIPALPEYINYIKKKPVFLMLDIKDGCWMETTQIIKEYDIEERCILLTFKYEDTELVAKNTTKAFISFLAENETYTRQVLSSPYKDRVMAYVSDKTPRALFEKLQNNSRLIRITHAGEWYESVTKPFEPGIYHEIAAKMDIQLLVTDFPAEVKKYMESSKIEKWKSNILKLHQTKFRWFQEKKLDSIAYILHADVNYIHSNGWVEHKSDVIENIQSNKLTYSNVEVLRADVTISDNTAIVLGTGMFSVSLNDKPIVIKLLYTEVYTNIDKSPQLIHRHACRLD